jgi:hypothetical protein
MEMMTKLGSVAQEKIWRAVTDGHQKQASATERNLRLLAAAEGHPAAVKLYDELRTRAPHLRRVNTYPDRELRPGFSRGYQFRPGYDDPRPHLVDVLAHRQPGEFLRLFSEAKREAGPGGRVSYNRERSPISTPDLSGM